MTQKRTAGRCSSLVETQIFIDLLSKRLALRVLHMEQNENQNVRMCTAFCRLVDVKYGGKIFSAIAVKLRENDIQRSLILRTPNHTGIKINK